MFSKSIRNLIWGLCGGAIVILFVFTVRNLSPYEPLFVSPQVWAHRGYTERYAQNSIPAFKEAIGLGATGIEMDIFWDESLHTFVVSHDKPYILPYGEILTLTMALDSLSSFKKLYYWLDLKNLNKANSSVIIDSLSAILDRYKVSKNIFVESDKGWQLRKMDRAGIRTLYWVQYSRSFPKRMLKLIYLKSLLAISDFDGLTTADYLYDKSFQRNFSNYPIFVWYINDAEKIRKLVFSQSVNVVLTNTNLFYLNQRDN